MRVTSSTGVQLIWSGLMMVPQINQLPMLKLKTMLLKAQLVPPQNKNNNIETEQSCTKLQTY